MSLEFKVFKKLDSQDSLKHYEDCLLVRRSVFIEEQEIDSKIEIDKFENESIFFVGYLNKDPVTTGRLRVIEDENTVKFERIATLKSQRGKGLGKKLMLEMQAYAKNNFKGHVLKMHSQESATTFYESIGWRREGELFIEAEIIHQTLIFP